MRVDGAKTFVLQGFYPVIPPWLQSCLSALVVYGLLLPAPAHVKELRTFAGQASVIDGDTIEVHGERIRLNGIDAPESRQVCQRADGAEYRCGQAAALALADWIGRSVVTCEPHGKDRYRRTIATCSARGEDMGRWLVSAGHALAFRRYSSNYVPDEQRAQAANAGIWQGRFVAPWDWRKGQR